MKNKRYNWQYLVVAIVGVSLLTVLDQWTKHLAIRHLAGQPDIELIPGVLQLHYLENRGSAFGLMQNKTGIFIILTLVFFAAAVYVYCKLPKTKRYLPLYIITLVLLAGAIGNLIDRVRLGYVVDFIYFSLINFPIFNFADIYITVSGVFIFIFVLFYYKEEDFTFLQLKSKTKK